MSRLGREYGVDVWKVVGCAVRRNACETIKAKLDFIELKRRLHKCNVGRWEFNRDPSLCRGMPQHVYEPATHYQRNYYLARVGDKQSARAKCGRLIKDEGRRIENRRPSFFIEIESVGETSEGRIV